MGKGRAGRSRGGLGLGWALVLSSLVACGGRAPAPRGADSARPEGPAAEQEVPALRPFSAFAVYTMDQTLLVPAGDAHPPVQAHGQWLVAPDAPELVIHYDQPEDPELVGLRPCPCTTVEGACLNKAIRRTVDVAAGFAVAWAEPCSCYGRAGFEVMDATPGPVQPVFRSGGYPTDYVPCDLSSPPGAVTSVVSGVLYLTASGSSLADQCGNEGGLNLYDAWSEEVRLVDGPRAPSAPTVAWPRCTDYPVDLSEVPEAAEPDDEAADQDLESAEDCSGDCGEADPCDLEMDLSYPVLRSGRLCWRGEAMGAMGGQAHWAACVPLTRESCPSPLDPCGEVAPFADQVSDADSFWISTDGRFALSLGAEGLSVLGRDPAAPAAEAVAAPEGEILGVLFFEAAAPLAAAMEHDFRPDPPPDGEVQTCDADAGCTGGALCDEVDGVCQPRCGSDSDCAWRGRCGARCHADGHCGPEPTGQCDDADFPCPSDYFCVEGRCDSCRRDEDCDQGVCEEGGCSNECWSERDCQGAPCQQGRCVRDTASCEPGLTAAQLGERCFAELRAARWGEAERLCRCGLAASAPERVRGALLYNLGRVAEGRGDVEAARTLYQQSLEARGENAEVRRRLEALPRR